MRRPTVGENVLIKPVPAGLYDRYTARPVRNPNDYQIMVTLRAMTFMSEQDCPYEEEFDQNDMCGTNFILFHGSRPIGTLRLRWFAGFAKLERTAILEAYRGTGAIKVLLAEAFELVARKGYQKMISHIQSRYWPLWSNTFRCRRLIDRPTFWFSDYEYCEIEIPIPAHPRAIETTTNPYTIIRPEGDWDRSGVLDASANRQVDEPAAA